MCEVLAANDSVTPVKPFNLCVCPQGALWQRSARLFTLLLSCALAHGAISSFRLILSNVKLDHLFPVFFIFLLFFFFHDCQPSQRAQGVQSLANQSDEDRRETPLFINDGVYRVSRAAAASC